VSAYRRLESVESEVQRLQAQLADMREMLRVNSQPHSDAHGLTGIEPFSQPQLPDTLQQQCRESVSLTSPQQIATETGADVAGFMPPTSANLSNVRGEIPLQSRIRPVPFHGDGSRPSKKRRSGFKVREEPISDFVSMGMITLEYAVDCFTT
jgi:hypothetical protein